MHDCQGLVCLAASTLASPNATAAGSGEDTQWTADDSTAAVESTGEEPAQPQRPPALSELLAAAVGLHASIYSAGLAGMLPQPRQPCSSRRKLTAVPQSSWSAAGMLQSRG